MRRVRFATSRPGRKEAILHNLVAIIDALPPEEALRRIDAAL